MNWTSGRFLIFYLQNIHYALRQHGTRSVDICQGLSLGDGQDSYETAYEVISLDRTEFNLVQKRYV
jgi:hypothetical protein